MTPTLITTCNTQPPEGTQTSSGRPYGDLS